MKRVLLWFVIYLSLSIEFQAKAEFHAEETPQHYFTEQVARRFPNKGKSSRFDSVDAIPKRRPNLGLTYRDPAHLSTSENVLRLTKSPSNQRYYEVERNSIGNQDAILQFVSRQPKSIWDDDRFALDTDPEYQTFETLDYAGADIEDSKFEEESASEEIVPIGSKTPVHNDPGKASGYYSFLLVVSTAAFLIGMLAIALICYKFHKRNRAVLFLECDETGTGKKYCQNGDRKLRQYAQMYHFLHQKRKILSLSSSSELSYETGSEVTSEECITSLFVPIPGPLHDLEIENTLQEDGTTRRSSPLHDEEIENTQFEDYTTGRPSSLYDAKVENAQFEDYTTGRPSSLYDVKAENTQFEDYTTGRPSSLYDVKVENAQFEDYTTGRPSSLYDDVEVENAQFEDDTTREQVRCYDVGKENIQLEDDKLL
jgi:nitrogen fixation-related uncharacterized protein